MVNDEIIYTFNNKCQISSKRHASFFFRNRSAQGPWVAHLRIAVQRVREKHHIAHPRVSLCNFETIRGSLMKPKWQKLASSAHEICTL